MKSQKTLTVQILRQTFNEMILYEDYDTLDLDENLFTLVERGRKTTTIRRGLRLAKVGTPLILRTKSRSLPIVLHSIEIKEFGNLTDEDARRDGFSSKHGLQSALKECYHSILETDAVTILHFEIKPEASK